jgi:hypothetical protein|tara:strand:- start:25615 stop:25905 length:291 start_codon:yes stop_codon:yes gene_type:complete
MSSSPYSKTNFSPDGTLGILTIRPVPAYSDDALYTVEPQYHQRPDLLAYDLYKDQKLWWIFAQRNLDVMEDPIYDLTAGKQIYLPQADKVKEELGD